MNKAVRLNLVGLWVVLATAALTRLLLTDLRMPTALPESFWLWLGRAFNVQDAEAQAALEVWTALAFSFVVISVLTLLARSVWRRVSHSQTDRKGA